MMNRDDKFIDHVLKDWDFDPDKVSVRLVETDDRQVLQLRVDMGVLQLEVTGRPDGTSPNDRPSMLVWILDREATEDDAEFELTFDQCVGVDREFAQFYHRRICWMELREFQKAILDADHTLKLMDACLRHSPSQDWTLSHEQHRPFVIFHRTQAAALARVEEGDDGRGAIEELDKGLAAIEKFYDDYEIEEDFADDELARRLIEIREDLRSRFDVGPTLSEQLAEAIESEKFELAARLRDEINKKR